MPWGYTTNYIRMWYSYKRVYPNLPQRNWVFATNSNRLIPISFLSDDVNLWYFNLWLFDPTELIVWNIKGLQHMDAKI